MPIALATMVAFLRNIRNNERKSFSPLFLYYEGRDAEGTKDSDSGMTIRNGLRALRDKGVCQEEDWPYLPSRWAWKPHKKAYKNAKDHRIDAYWRLRTLCDLTYCLEEGYPAIVGMNLHDESWARAGKLGRIGIPSHDDKPAGGHAVVAVGYDNLRAKILCRNSMGQEWGEAGYFWMPFAYFENQKLIGDVWTIR